MQDILDRLARIEAKLDALLLALEDECYGTDDDDPPALTLDGEPCGLARDDSQPL